MCFLSFMTNCVRRIQVRRRVPSTERVERSAAGVSELHRRTVKNCSSFIRG